ncbi:Secologanin synthase [Handroanthus impetiginosus]|uniref:Secologanin synthase n=1 Tax=Handroanthus impetiginosus TaxID=429701 RepID=A0A2G9GKY0_9LAMI|nr:Secologanin synthase [Handroanthus impetiginosus]
MEALLCSVALSCAVIALVYAWKILNRVWFRPKNLEKCFRQQGFKGNSYRVLLGDLKEMRMMMKEANSRPINFSNDIVPRVLPFTHRTLKNYGQNCFVWFGPRPAVIILDPEVIKEILSKSYIFQKPAGNAFSRLLARGLASYETDKWAKHRKLINPAFHVEKLKLMVPSFYLSCAEMLNKW